MAVDDHFGQVTEHLGRPVTPRREVEELRRLVDEPRPGEARIEGGVRQYVLEEGDVRLHAADAELAQRAQHLADCEGKGIGVGDDLEEQRVIERRYAGARIAIAGIQTDSESGAGAPGVDTAGIGQEVVGGVLGGDAALHCEPTGAHHLLRADADLRRPQLISFADAQLRLDQVDASDLLGDGVLDLQARVDFDEIMARSVAVGARPSASSASRGSAPPRLPRPPRPWAALTRVAPCSDMKARAAPICSPAEPRSSTPGTTGTLAFNARPLAATLSPIRATTSERGPMKRTPRCSQARANSGFSERKP